MMKKVKIAIGKRLNAILLFIVLLMNFNGVSQKSGQIDLIHSLVSNTPDKAHYFYKQLNLTVDNVKEHRDYIIFTYSTDGLKDSYIDGASFVMGSDFRNIIGVELRSRNYNFQNTFIAEMDKNGYKFVSFNNNETEYSNGIYRIVLNSIFIEGIKTYCVQIWKKTI